MSFQTEYTALKDKVEEYLYDFLKRKDDGSKCFEALTYAVRSGGKRIRPVLALSVMDMLGKKTEDVLPFAIGVELIHTYSLIHDDMPIMDDDDMRRGKETVHIKYNDQIALLSGDYLQGLAFQACMESQINPYLIIECMQTIAEAAIRMVHGQELDLDKGKKTAEELVKVNLLKTGALISASVWLGGLVGEITVDKYENLGTFAKNLGLAFQVKDDLLDGDGFIPVIGKEDAEKMLENLTEEAKFAIHEWGEKSYFLQDLANYLLSREE